MAHNRLRAFRLVAPLFVALVAASCGGGGEPTNPAPNNNNNNTGGNPTGGGGGGGGPASAVGVTVTDNVFTPSSVSGARNGTVTWTWSNSGYGVPHNVTFDGGGSSGDKTDGTYERTFTTAGTFTYRCTNHTGMNGTITVP
jgi:plastocyanin